jgi:N-methylhydantoinase A
MFDKENNQRLSSLWGAYGAWARGLSKKTPAKFDILYLGLEQFCVLHPEKQSQIWDSPWGAIQAPQVKSQMLSLQPTTSIAITPWGELAFSKTALGYEPGPMFMGRGQVPTLLDLWGENTSEIKGVAERKSAQGLQKFKNQLLALNKTATTPYETEGKLLKGLQQLAFQKLTSEISLQIETPKVICMGALASLFVPELKKRLPHLQFEMLPETETSSLLSQGPGHVV